MSISDTQANKYLTNSRWAASNGWHARWTVMQASYFNNSTKENQGGTTNKWHNHNQKRGKRVKYFFVLLISHNEGCFWAFCKVDAKDWAWVRVALAARPQTTNVTKKEIQLFITPFDICEETSRSPRFRIFKGYLWYLSKKEIAIKKVLILIHII